MKRTFEENRCPECGEDTLSGTIHSDRRGVEWTSQCQNGDCDFEESDFTLNEGDEYDY